MGSGSRVRSGSGTVAIGIGIGTVAKHYSPQKKFKIKMDRDPESDWDRVTVAKHYSPKKNSKWDRDQYGIGSPILEGSGTSKMMNRELKNLLKIGEISQIQYWGLF